METYGFKSQVLGHNLNKVSVKIQISSNCEVGDVDEILEQLDLLKRQLGRLRSELVEATPVTVTDHTLVPMVDKGIS